MDDISIIARLGSGSACRSIFGGFVIWDKGFEEDFKEADKKSKAIQHKDENHWDDLCCVICVADSDKKKVSSTSGMKTSVDTSKFLEYRAKEIVPLHLEKIKKAIDDKDWNSL